VAVAAPFSLSNSVIHVSSHRRRSAGDPPASLAKEVDLETGHFRVPEGEDLKVLLVDPSSPLGRIAEGVARRVR
jgi:hypothetical protein